MKDTLLVSKALIELEAKAEEQHWKEQAERLQKQEAEAESYDPEAILNTYKKQKKHIATQVLAFARENANLFEDNEPHPLSWNNNHYTSFKKRSFYNNIDKLIKFKLLDIHNAHYDSRSSVSKTYTFNFPNFFKLSRQFSSLYHISANNGDKREYTSSVESKDDAEGQSLEVAKFDPTKVKIRKRMRMDVTGISNDTILEALKANYPQYGYYKAKVDELNRVRPFEERIKWQFNLKFRTKGEKRYLVKVGFRASSLICSYKEHANKNPFYVGKWRKDYLEAKFGPECGHYDVNGSIYRLTYNLNHDEMFPQDKDIYEHIYGQEFESKDDRQAFKAISMRLMFGNANCLGNQVERRFQELANEEFDFDRRDWMQQELLTSKMQMFSKLGNSYDSEIFLHESCTYLEMLSHLDKDAILVYDSFYFSNSRYSSSYLNALYFRCFSFYKSHFSQTFNKLPMLYHISANNGDKPILYHISANNGVKPILYHIGTHNGVKASTHFSQTFNKLPMLYHISANNGVKASRKPRKAQKVQKTVVRDNSDIEEAIQREKMEQEFIRQCHKMVLEGIDDKWPVSVVNIFEDAFGLQRTFLKRAHWQPAKNDHKQKLVRGMYALIREVKAEIAKL